MGEDPIIIRPGVYPGAKEGDDDRVGICLVFDDDGSWTVTEAGGKITITMPSDGKFIVVPDKTPPDTGKLKKAILRVNGDFTDMTFNGVKMTSDGKSELAIAYVERIQEPGGEPSPAQPA